MLTGGSSAEGVYKVWAKLPAFKKMSGVKFYFGDERCVPPEHPESNYGMAMRTLFGKGVPIGCSVLRMEAEEVDRESAALRYESLLPLKIDVLLLGVGEDGHIASLYPGSSNLQEKTRKVLPAKGDKPPVDRLTILPSVITQANAIFVLARGPVKAQVLVKVLSKIDDFDTIPARLALKNATWLLDSPLLKENNEQFT
jgi:6-phosphogluconolactonase